MCRCIHTIHGGKRRSWCTMSMPFDIYAYMHKICTLKHAHTHTQVTLTHTHIHTHTRTHALTHARTHACTHARTHARTILRWTKEVVLEVHSVSSLLKVNCCTIRTDHQWSPPEYTNLQSDLINRCNNC